MMFIILFPVQSSENIHIRIVNNKDRSQVYYRTTTILMNDCRIEMFHLSLAGRSFCSSLTWMCGTLKEKGEQ